LKLVQFLKKTTYLISPLWLTLISWYWTRCS